MSIIDKLKDNLGEGKAIGKIADQWLEKGQVLGQKGLQNTREVMDAVYEKTSDVARMARIRIDLASHRKSMTEAARNLGIVCLNLLKENQFSDKDPTFLAGVEAMKSIQMIVRDKENEYDQLRKMYSESYVVSQLSEDLAEANATMDMVIVTETSNVVNKTLKEILLPKKALISALKRGSELIIPDGNTQLKVGDKVIVIGSQEDVEKVTRRFSG